MHAGRPGGGRVAKVAKVAIALVMAVGCLRLLGIALHDPVVGYANSYDMVRVQACLGLWPRRDGALVLGASPDGPITDYVYTGQRSWRTCYLSSELLLDGAALLLHRASGADAMDLRLVGGLKAALLTLAAALLSWLLLRRSPAAALANGLVFALVLADPLNALYLNTLYCEFACLFFAYLSVALALVVARYDDGLRWQIALAAALFLLGTSKVQHALLPLVIGGAVVLVARRRTRRLALVLAVACGATLALQGIAASRPGLMRFVRRANATDSVLGAILPAFDDPVRGARRLGLPERCAGHAGKTWYSPGVQQRHPCPEVFRLSRARVAAVMLGEPVALARMVRGALSHTRPWILDHIGTVSGGRVPWLARLSLSTIVDRLPHGVYAAGFALLAVAGLLSFLVACAAVSAGASSLGPPWVLVLLLALTTFEVLVASFFGDGYVELSKHAHLAATAWTVGLFAAVAAALLALWRSRRRDR
jgi:hypothetical protein